MDTRNGQLAGASALLFGILLISFLGKPADLSPQLEYGELRPVVGTSTLEFNPDLVVTKTALEKIFPSMGATSTTTPKAKTESVVPTTPKAEPTTTVSVPIPASGLRGALVNILCTANNATLRGLSGSGVIIDPQGIILTAAHVAQAQLLSEKLGQDAISCVIRTGDPARSAYKAKLIYISEDWLRANPTTLISSQPLGTGENDFALLAITGSAGSALPSSFPYVSATIQDVSEGDSILAGGYGGQYLTSAQVRTSLSILLHTGSIDGIYTFHTTTQDVLSILGGEVAQIGSSGGGVTNGSGKLLGIITTSEVSGDFKTRHLRAITIRHIEERFSDDMGTSLANYINSASVPALVASYSSKASELGAFLAKAIGQE